MAENEETNMQEVELKSTPLHELGGGAVEELYQEGLAKILENVFDPNTEANKKREFTLKIAFMPSKSRDALSYDITYDVKLAKPLGYGNVLFVGKTKSGIVARDNDIQQLNIFDKTKNELSKVEVEKA